MRIAGDNGYLTLKSGDPGAVRLEFEYEIPLRDAEALLGYCRAPLIEKTRHEAPWAGRVWMIDVFEGARAGLALAEIELSHPDEDFERPPWAGAEVTSDPAYRNSNL